MTAAILSRSTELTLAAAADLDDALTLAWDAARLDPPRDHATVVDHIEHLGVAASAFNADPTTSTWDVLVLAAREHVLPPLAWKASQHRPWCECNTRPLWHGHISRDNWLRVVNGCWWDTPPGYASLTFGYGQDEAVMRVAVSEEPRYISFAPVDWDGEWTDDLLDNLRATLAPSKAAYSRSHDFVHLLLTEPADSPALVEAARAAWEVTP